MTDAEECEWIISGASVVNVYREELDAINRGDYER